MSVIEPLQRIIQVEIQLVFRGIVRSLYLRKVCQDVLVYIVREWRGCFDLVGS
jgi:hypothetical protein